MANKSIFYQFTGKYQLSKTLRFELKPVRKTAKFLKKNKVFEKDKLVDNHYHEIKYYFDVLHREFINETLQNVYFPAADYKKYFQVVEQLKKAKKGDKKEEGRNLQEIETGLRRKIVEQFNETAKNWKMRFAAKGIELKQNDVGILFEETVLAVLKEIFKNPPTDSSDAPAITFIDPTTGEEKNLFDSFKGFFTYFSNFNITKRNLYSEKEQDTAVANRAIDENLRRFVENIFQFGEKRNAYLQCGLIQKEQEAFKLEFHNKCLTQDGIDNYNRIIGGSIDENGEKLKGINEKINLYNQQHNDKKLKLKPFAQLFKQILSKKEKKGRFAEIIDDSKVFAILKDFIALNDNKLKEAYQLMNSFFRDGDTYDFEKIYIKGSALNTISQKWFSNWSVIRNLLRTDKKNKKSDEENGEITKLPDFVSVAQLRRVLELRSVAGAEEFVEAKDLFRDKYKDIYNTTQNHFKTFIEIWEQEWQDCIEKNEKEEKGYNVAKQNVEEMMENEKSYQKDSKEQITKIKAYCVAALVTFQMMKYFALEKGRKKVEPDNGVDNEFYNPFNVYYQDYPVLAYYNEFRNYLTKKAHLGRLLFPAFNGRFEQRHPFSKRNIDGAEKIKLNFENGMLLSGWDKNTESQYYGVLFQDGTKFLLGIMTKEHHDLFMDSQKFSNKTSSDGFIKIEYRQLNNVFRQLPRIAFANKNKEKYGITEELEEIREEFKKFQDARKNDKKLHFDNKKLEKLIDLYKRVLRDSFGKDFDLGEVLSRKYDSLNDFFSTIECKTYSLKFLPIKRDYVNDAVNEGKMFLFEIHNKDWNLKDDKRKIGTKNLHTLYFNALFDARNLENPIFKLSGGAEVFFRPKNEHLDKKKDKKGREVLEHKRYGENKVFLHIPTVLNMGAGSDFGFNGQVNKLIAKDKKEREIKIIGVDRGENNLAYFALIDQDGKFLDCGDLNGNLPNGETYLKKLEDKAKRRDEERKDWKTIENIKELKNGYISWVVRKLADMMLIENAVLVLEDLSVGFKRSRQKMEQQVYQKLELALAQKLNYLVQKDAPEGSSGHYLKAYQLTPRVATPQDIGKQCGAIFYVSPGYTSLTCPKCGYRKNISFNFENIKKAREFIKKTDLRAVYRNRIFNASYKAFDEKGNPKGEYGVSSNVERVRWNKKGTDYAKKNPENYGERIIKNSKSGVVKKYDMTSVFKRLFDENNVEYAKQNLSAKDLSIPESADYYRRLFWSLNILLHSRNSVSGVDKDGIPYAIDYIQCPRCLFHSDDSFQGHKYNGDANGAYNIARKGLLMLRKIQKAEDPQVVKWSDLKIDVNEWDDFTQNQWNPISKSRK